MIASRIVDRAKFKRALIDSWIIDRFLFCDQYARPPRIPFSEESKKDCFSLRHWSFVYTE